MQGQSLRVRIEDEVLVTAEGCEVLTQGVPKQMDDVEALRRDGVA